MSIDPHEVFVASTPRASRAARSPPPSDKARDNAWIVANACAAELVEAGLVRVPRLPPTVWVKPQASGKSQSVNRDQRKLSLDAAAPAKPTAKLSHVFSLQKAIDANAREASFLSYQSVLPLEGAKLAAAGLRSNSVRSSITEKAKTMGGGQQTPRINLGAMIASWATQAVSVAVTIGTADFLCRNEHNVETSNPLATCAMHPTQLFANDPLPSTFVMTSSARLLPHALPTRINAHSFLNTMRTIAKNELDFGQIRQRVPQQIESLRAICNSIVDATDGVNVWASWILLVYMLTDPRLRRLVQATSITDLEASTAFVFQNYGRAEITRRARLDVSKMSREDDDGNGNGAERTTKPKPKKRKKSRAMNEAKHAQEDDAEEDGAQEEEGGAEDELAITDSQLQHALCVAESDVGSSVPRSPSVASTTTASSSMITSFHLRRDMDKVTLSAKRKRQIACPVSQPLQPAGFLNYWHAALNSEYASILKTLITQSKAAATTASMDTLHGQAPEDLVPNKLLMRIASENAVKSAEAISSLVVTLPSRVPQIVTWRCRNYKNRIDCHVGLVRSTSDSTNTTLHVCRAFVPPPFAATAMRSGAAKHTVCVWSLAIKNTTPKDAATSILPGITESTTHLQAIQNETIRFSSRHRKAAVFERIKSRAAGAASDGALDTTLTGIARGFIVLKAKIVVGASQVIAGSSMAKTMADARRQAAQRGGFSPQNEYESCALLSQEAMTDQRTPEPYASPSNNLALGLQNNELLRDLMKNRSHKSEACRHMCGVASAQELAEASVEEMDKPSSLLVITDVDVKMLEDPTKSETTLPNRRDACLCKAAVTLTVAGDSPVRLPDLMQMFCADHVAQRGDHRARHGLFLQTMALGLAGAARASELNDRIASITASHVNSSIASAKRVLVGDRNQWAFLTLHQVFRVGQSNVPRSFETTPWSGVYGSPMQKEHTVHITLSITPRLITTGAGFDIGTSGGIGIRCSADTADKRCVHALYLTLVQC